VGRYREAGIQKGKKKGQTNRAIGKELAMSGTMSGQFLDQKSRLGNFVTAEMQARAEKKRKTGKKSTDPLGTASQVRWGEAPVQGGKKWFLRTRRKTGGNYSQACTERGDKENNNFPKGGGDP